jgi:hypothetical protein
LSIERELSLFLQLGFGLGASIALLAISIIQTRGGEGRGVNADLSTFGVLPLMWLFNQRPEILSAVSGVKEPTINNLRDAGMVSRRIAEDRLARELSP